MNTAKIIRYSTVVNASKIKSSFCDVISNVIRQNGVIISYPSLQCFDLIIFFHRKLLLNLHGFNAKNYQKLQKYF